MNETNINLRKIKKRLRIISLFNEAPLSDIGINNISWNENTKNYNFIYNGNLDVKITHKKEREGD